MPGHRIAMLAAGALFASACGGLLGGSSRPAEIERGTEMIRDAEDTAGRVEQRQSELELPGGSGH